MTAHAPGPWTIVPYGDGDSLVIHSDDENRVCFMATHGGTQSQWQRIQANARLIVAAPALYEALSALCNLDDGDRPELWQHSEHFDRARAALALVSQDAGLKSASGTLNTNGESKNG